MSREAPAQREPEPDIDYASFPSVRVSEGDRRWRAHQTRFSPWFYSAGPSGRFNLDHPDGTMYVASAATAAVREAAGELMVGVGVIDSDWADRRAVSQLVSPPGRLADLRSARAPRFGIVPGEITGPFADYRLTRGWAAAFNRSGFDGLRYSSRFSSPRSGFCEARFGPAGPADGMVIRTVPVRDVIARMRGYRVAERPSSLDITIIGEQ